MQISCSSRLAVERPGAVLVLLLLLQQLLSFLVAQHFDGAVGVQWRRCMSGAEGSAQYSYARGGGCVWRCNATEQLGVQAKQVLCCSNCGVAPGTCQCAFVVGWLCPFLNCQVTLAACP
jgi:hypothetical protein